MILIHQTPNNRWNYTLHLGGKQILVNTLIQGVLVNPGERGLVPEFLRGIQGARWENGTTPEPHILNEIRQTLQLNSH